MCYPEAFIVKNVLLLKRAKIGFFCRRGLLEVKPSVEIMDLSLMKKV